MFTSPFAIGAAVFVLALGAGMLPLVLRFGQRVLHAVVAAASGLFLGITFLHLLPELGALAARDRSAKLWACVLAGVLAVFLADVLLRRDADEHDEEHGGEHPAHHGGHRVVGIATFVGLSLHTLGGAIAIGLGRADSELHTTLVAATLVHKSAEAFSLASVLLLAELPRKAIARLLVAYALVTPVGIAIGRGLMGVIEHTALESADGMASGLAAGTFLYVAVAELLPEVFHGTADRGLKVALILLGIAASTLAFAGRH